MRRRTTLQKATILLVAILLLSAASAGAQQQSGIGVGVMLGEPTGLAAVSWLGGGNALDFVAAWSFGGGGSIYLHSDYQFHMPVEQRFTVFAGLGGFVILQDDPVAGFRVPLGATYAFREAPLDVFLEVAPGMRIIPATSFAVYGGLGIRYYF